MCIRDSENFSEICITSESKIVEDQNIDKEVEVVTEKAEGSKCSLCWKIKSKKCERINCQIS